MAALSGQTTVTTAGTEVMLGERMLGFIAVKALSTNTGIMYIGNAGDNTVSSSTGYPLLAGEEIIVEDLGNLWVDASNSGEKVAWMLLCK